MGFLYSIRLVETYSVFVTLLAHFVIIDMVNIRASAICVYINKNIINIMNFNITSRIIIIGDDDILECDDPEPYDAHPDTTQCDEYI